MFLLDSGIRSPTELINVKISGLYNNCKELHIREEISKTFCRRIKLMLCSDLLKDYIAHKNLKNDDYLFKINPVIVNQYLKIIAVTWDITQKKRLKAENPDYLANSQKEMTSSPH